MTLGDPVILRTGSPDVIGVVLAVGPETALVRWPSGHSETLRLKQLELVKWEPSA